MKKDLKKKLVLVSRTPKVKTIIENVIPEEVPNNIIENIKLQDNVNYEAYSYIKECIREILYYVMHASKEDKDKMEYSIGINNFIKEYKFDKNVHQKIRDDIKPVFYPMLNGSSKYFCKYFLKDFPTIIDEVLSEFLYENIKDKGYQRYILNELHNLINYRKTTIKVLPKYMFDKIHDLFLNIKEEFAEQYILGKKIYYTKKDFNLEPYNVLKDNMEYKIIYVVPKVSYDGQKSQKLSKINARGLMAPVIFGLDDKPISTKLWNSVVELNQKYNVEIPLKCLVPFDCYIKDNKVIKMSNKELVRCFGNLKMFKEKLNRKISLILFSITETYYSRRYM